MPFPGRESREHAGVGNSLKLLLFCLNVGSEHFGFLEVSGCLGEFQKLREACRNKNPPSGA